LLLTLSRYALGVVAGIRNNWSFVNEVVIVDGVPVLPTRGQIVLVADHLGLSPMINDPASFDRLGRLLANCDRVILASHPSRRAAWAKVLKCAGIAVEMLTPELDALGALQLMNYGGKSAVLVATGPLGLRDRLMKRSLDLAVAVFAIIISSPIMVIVTLLVKLTSRGPIFFRQERVGQGNRIFSVVKFRTMRVDGTDTAGARSASRGDDRVTPLGKILRRTSLDEVPQLINVILGDMSLVGPRPHALGSTAGDALFWHADDRYWERGTVKPGMTGLAQIRGYRGATETREDLVDRVQADLEYLSGWSIWRDVAILVRTAKVLVHQNAY
jgi:lipopolysaccharide/colanic/teichoic acid biosynthesis glycosyltransferase